MKVKRFNALLSLSLLLSLSHLLCMEQEQSTIQAISLVNIVPAELVHSIAEFLAGKKITEAIHYSNDNESCIIAVPYPISDQTSNKTELYNTVKWFAPINLNNCEIADTFEDQQAVNNKIFSVHCYKIYPKCKDPYYPLNSSQTTYYLQNILAKKVYETTITQETTDCFFEDFNDNQIMLIAGNRPTRERGFKYQAYIVKEPRYIYWIKKFTDETIRNDLEKDTHNQNNQQLNHQPLSLPGTLATLALYKTMNRFVIAEKDRNILVYDILDETNSTKRLCAPFEFEETIRRICFLTPNTLLGLTQSGKLYTFSLPKMMHGKNENETITASKQTICNKNKESITLKNFAVDPCNPRHVLLQTDKNIIIYYNLKNCNTESISGIPCLTSKYNHLWFYNNTICLGKDFSSTSLHPVPPKIARYTLHTLDVTLPIKTELVVFK